MGYHSSPAVTFLMTVFNLRLGWWLGNPGPEGAVSYRHDGPAVAIHPLLQETLGLTTDSRPYVNLFDLRTSTISASTKWCGGAAASF